MGGFFSLSLFWRGGEEDQQSVSLSLTFCTVKVSLFIVIEIWLSSWTDAQLIFTK